MTFEQELGPQLAALQEVERILKLGTDSDSKLQLAQNYEQQAWILISLQQLDQANGVLERQAALCLELGDLSALEANYHDRAEVLRSDARFNEALALLDKQESLCRQNGNIPGLLLNFESRVSILRDRAHSQNPADTTWCEQAMELLKQVEGLSTTSGELQGCYGSQAEVMMDWGRLGAALELFRKQESICDQLQDREALERCYRGQARILKAWGQNEMAQQLVARAERLTEPFSPPQIQRRAV